MVSNNTLTAGPSGTATVTASYDAPLLLQQDALLTFKLNVTDIPPGTAAPAQSEAFVTVRIKSPLLAHFDFNSDAQPQRDISGNGHDALNTSANPFPAVVDGALSLSETDVMVVPGVAADLQGGLNIPADTYTVAFRFSIEEPGSGSGLRGLLQKGDANAARQPAFWLQANSDTLRVSETTSTAVQVQTVGTLLNQQWLNFVFVKRADGFDVYIDNELINSFDYGAGELSQANSGNLYLGNTPQASRSIVGLMDDVQIYNRVLSEQEREQILPPPPVGEVAFTETSSVADEYAVTDNAVTINLERRRGSKDALTVYVDLNAAISTASPGSQADLVTPTDVADLAFAGGYTPGTGLAVTWPAGSRGIQSFTVNRDTADDGIREGTETARFNIVDYSAADSAEPAVHTLRLNDLTPNPFGNFSVTAPDNNILTENSTDTYSLCIVRE